METMRKAKTNPVPQAWADPALEPSGGSLRRTLVVNTGLLWGVDDSFLRLVLRHEIGHVMGFIHEEVNDPHPFQEGCDVDDEARPLTPVDPQSIMTTPGCAGVYSDDAAILTQFDRLSAFFLHHTPRARFETRTPAVVLVILTAIAAACEPEPTGEPEPKGLLEFEHPYIRLYRLDQRVDAKLVEGNTEHRECGVLSERAYTELESTISGLSPRVDYSYDRTTTECTDPPGALIYIEGFEHSPFSCDFSCCGTDLSRAALIYSFIESNLRGNMPTYDGEPYVAVERIEPCP